MASIDAIAGSEDIWHQYRPWTRRGRLVSTSVELALMSEPQLALSDRAIQIIADNKIRAAIDAGEFDNLPGFGKRSAIIDEPYDPHWWIRRKLKREELLGIDLRISDLD
jgi:DnaJ homologue, subfamily C, member 28, conserved domain